MIKHARRYKGMMLFLSLVCMSFKMTPMIAMMPGAKQQQPAKFTMPVVLSLRSQNFSWINPEDAEGKRLGGMRLPANRQEVEALAKLHVGRVITLREESLPQEFFEGLPVDNVHIPVIDYQPPTIDQVKDFIAAVDEMHAQDKNVVTHCRAGMGRTGTMLACWLVARKGMSADDAINYIRDVRRPSIDTRAQEQLIRTFYQELQQQRKPSEKNVEYEILLGKDQNFSWINPHDGKGELLAGMQEPSSKAEIAALQKLNVGLLISLTESTLPHAYFTGLSVDNVHIPIADYKPPTIEQIQHFVGVVDAMHAQGKNVVTHCKAGLGRTGTMLASWLVARKGMSAKDAIAYVRRLRPYSIETKAQERIISEYYDVVHAHDEE